MMAEDPVRARVCMAIGQDHRCAMALHPDLMGSVDRAVDGGALGFKGGEEHAMEAYRPIESFADDMEIALRHGSVLPFSASLTMANRFCVSRGPLDCSRLPLEAEKISTSVVSALFLNLFN